MRRLLPTPAFGALASLRLRRAALHRSPVRTLQTAVTPTFAARPFGRAAAAPGSRCPAPTGGAAARRFFAAAPPAPPRTGGPSAGDAAWLAGAWDALRGSVDLRPPALLLRVPAAAEVPWLEALRARWSVGSVEVSGARRAHLRIADAVWLRGWLERGAPQLRTPELRRGAEALAEALGAPAPAFAPAPNRAWAAGFAATVGPSIVFPGAALGNKQPWLRAQSPQGVDAAALGAFCDAAVVGFAEGKLFGGIHAGKKMWQVTAEATLDHLAALATNPALPPAREAERLALFGSFRELRSAGALLRPASATPEGRYFLEILWGHEPASFAGGRSDALPPAAPGTPAEPSADFLHYLGGAVDGDGNIGAICGRYPRLQLTTATADRPRLERIRHELGGRGAIHDLRRESASDFVLTRGVEMRWLLPKIAPQLRGAIKRRQYAAVAPLLGLDPEPGPEFAPGAPSRRWVAGLFSSDGHLGLSFEPSAAGAALRPRAHAVITNTQLSLLEDCRRAWCGAGRIFPMRNELAHPQRRPAYTWQLNQRRDVERFAAFFGEAPYGSAKVRRTALVPRLHELVDAGAHLEGSPLFGELVALVEEWEHRWSPKSEVAPRWAAAVRRRLGREPRLPEPSADAADAAAEFESAAAAAAGLPVGSDADADAEVR